MPCGSKLAWRDIVKCGTTDLAPGQLTLARATVERFLERAHRLYEQERGKPEGFPQLGAYVRRWCRWATSGVAGTGSALATVGLYGPRAPMR